MKHIFVTLIGSTRFEETMREEETRLTLEGFNVFTLINTRQEDKDDPQLRKMMDEMIREKIDLCDRVHVINKNGYIGKHTASEIDYARRKEKMITYMVPLREPVEPELFKAEVPVIEKLDPHWIAAKMLDVYKHDIDRAIEVTGHMVHDIFGYRIKATIDSCLENQNPLTKIPFGTIKRDMKYYQAIRDALMLLLAEKHILGNS